MTFADATSVEKVLASGPHELDGKKVDPKVAFPKRSNPRVSMRRPLPLHSSWPARQPARQLPSGGPAGQLARQHPAKDEWARAAQFNCFAA